MNRTIKKNFLKILLLFLLWRATLFIIGILAQNIIAYDPSFPYAGDLLAHFGVPQWLYSWGNFDGVHYITIVEKGYIGTGLIQAFFPGFPFIIKFLNIFINNALISSLLISNFFFLLFLFVWHSFIQRRYSKKMAKLSSLIILLFPTSFFFGAIYNESLFLLLVILTFWFAEEKKYLFTAITIFLASATKVVGVLLIPAVMTEILFGNYDFSKSSFKEIHERLRTGVSLIGKKFKPIFLISLGSLGIIAYMVFLQGEFQDPLYFFHVQSEFGGIRQESLVMYPQVVFRYIKILLSVRPFDLNYLSAVSELSVGIFGLIAILFSFRKVKLSYFVFAVSAFILPTLTGTFSSMPRYVLISFPIFILLASWAEKSKIFMYGWLIFSTILLIFSTILFIQGYWVA